MSTVRIAVNFDNDAPEFPFFKIAEYVNDFDTVYNDDETTTVEYQVYDEYQGYVETIIDQHPGTIAYTVNGIVS